MLLHTLKIIPLLLLLSTAQAGIISDIKEKINPPNKTQQYKLTTKGLEDIPYQKWQDTESGRFAHALQYEDKLAKPVPYVFTKGKDRGQEGIDYFEHLCKTEGKDYIYRTATNVDTVAQLRSFEIPNSTVANDLGVQTYLFHPYALEAPMFFDDLSAGKFLGIENKNIEGNVKESNTSGIFRGIRGLQGIPYSNYQIKFNDGRIYNFKYNIKKNIIDEKNQNKSLENIDYKNIEKLDKITARYGFTWKGFSRLKDREHGIAGGDLIIVDLEKNEIIAIERTFIKARLSFSPATNVNWNGVGCFEQYKNYSIYQNEVFEGKNFNEKLKLIDNSEPNQSYIPKFIHKIIRNNKNN